MRDGVRVWGSPKGHKYLRGITSRNFDPTVKIGERRKSRGKEKAKEEVRGDGVGLRFMSGKKKESGDIDKLKRRMSVVGLRLGVLE